MAIQSRKESNRKHAAFIMTLALSAVIAWTGAAGALTQVIFSEDFDTPHDFCKSWWGWSASNGVWEICPLLLDTSPPYDRKSPVKGHCAGTVMNDVYSQFAYSSLKSPSVQLPSVARNEELHLLFHHWFSFGSYYDAYSHGQVWISVWSGTGWEEPVAVGDLFTGNSNVWSQVDIDLTAYQGKKVQLLWYFEATRESSWGWYIDSVQVVKTTFDDRYLDISSIADMSGNGSPEIVSLRLRGNDGQPVVDLTDTKDGKIIKEINFFSFGGITASYYVAGINGSSGMGLDGKGGPDIAVLSGPSDTGLVQIKDSKTRATICTLSFFAKPIGNAKRTMPREISIVPDMNGNGVEELAVLGLDLENGVYVYVIKDPKTRATLLTHKYPLN